MVKKLRAMADRQAGKGDGGGLLDGQLAQTVKDSAQQIWLAGLGAFAKAQGEGAKLFESLMKDGAAMQKRTTDAAGAKLDDVTGRMTAMAEEVGHKANQQWDKLESIFEERTARALSRLGVPTARDVAALTERVDALAAAVAALDGGRPAAPAKRPAAAKKAARASAAASGTAAPRRAPARKGVGVAAGKRARRSTGASA